VTRRPVFFPPFPKRTSSNARFLLCFAKSFAKSEIRIAVRIAVRYQLATSSNRLQTEHISAQPRRPLGVGASRKWAAKSGREK